MHELEQGTWGAYNNFLLYGEVDRFSKILARYELFKKIIELPGDIVEGGVFKGTGLFYWAKMIEIFNPRTNRKVVGFDTFQGYPLSANAQEMEAAREFEDTAGFGPVTVEELTQLATLQGLQERIELVEGDVTSTFTKYTNANPGFRIALLNLDFDTYDATRAALDALFQLVVPHGIVVLDEYGAAPWGESNAVDEFIQGHDIKLQSIPWTHSPSAYFIKGQVSSD